MNVVSERPHKIVGRGANGAVIVNDRDYGWTGQNGPSWSARRLPLAANRLTVECVANQGRKIILRFAGRGWIAYCCGAARCISSVWAIFTRSARDFAAIFFMMFPRCIFTVI